MKALGPFKLNSEAQYWTTLKYATLSTKSSGAFQASKAALSEVPEINAHQAFQVSRNALERVGPEAKGSVWVPAGGEENTHTHNTYSFVFYTFWLLPPLPPFAHPVQGRQSPAL